MHDHRDVMQALAIEHGWRRGIELGLGSGLLFERFLALGVHMIGVDIGARKDRKRQVQQIEAGYRNSAVIFWMPTRDAANHVADEWADFCFVDAAHSYEAVRDDIARWQAKVKPEGWFGGHDYHPVHPGVVRAVDSAFPGGIDLLDGHIWARRP